MKKIISIANRIFTLEGYKFGQEFAVLFNIKQKDQKGISTYRSTPPFRYGHLLKKDGNYFSIQLGTDKIFDGFFFENEKNYYIHLDGDSYQFSKIKKGSLEEDKNIVKSNMPGRVVKILKKPGESVKEGEGIAILEAMKMQTTFKAGCDGVIEKLPIMLGDIVQSDSILAKIKSSPLPRRLDSKKDIN